jgi:uncharacterized membrane protein
MIPSSLHYFPLAWPFLVILAALLAASAVVVAVGALRFASASMGISAPALLFLLLLALLGSYINIPVAYLPNHTAGGAHVVPFFGMQYVVPDTREWRGTIIAVNVGGALIPTLLSLYVMAKNHLYLLSVVATAVVAIVCHLIARPVVGLGIAEPIFIPPFITALTAVVLSLRYAAPLAYISGSLGTLIGADLLNLGKVQGLGAPIASIGGAGTFDGIFVTGLVALLFAGLGIHVGREEERMFEHWKLFGTNGSTAKR